MSVKNEIFNTEQDQVFSLLNRSISYPGNHVTKDKTGPQVKQEVDQEPYDTLSLAQGEEVSYETVSVKTETFYAECDKSHLLDESAYKHPVEHLNHSSVEIKEEIDYKFPLVDDEINIKSEDEGDIGSVCVFETASNPVRSSEQMADEPSKLDQGGSYGTTHFEVQKQDRIRHSGRKLFICDQCDFGTIYLGNLKKHEKKHSRGLSFACDTYDYRTVSSNCSRHQMKGSGEKPFACDQCDYKTAYISRLRQHELTHSGEKPFACDQCDYKTIYSHVLKRHQLKHRGEAVRL